MMGEPKDKPEFQSNSIEFTPAQVAELGKDSAEIATLKNLIGLAKKTEESSEADSDQTKKNLNAVLEHAFGIKEEQP